MKKYVDGFTLLEIMAAMAIMAIVLVAVFKMHTQTISISLVESLFNRQYVQHAVESVFSIVIRQENMNFLLIVLVFRLNSVDLHITGKGSLPRKHTSKEGKAEVVFCRYLIHSVGPFYPKEARQAKGLRFVGIKGVRN